MSDIKYQVREKDRVVICKLINCEFIAADRMAKYVEPYYTKREFLIPGTFVGVARCSPDDEFDVERGKKIALTRAKRKRGIAVNKIIRDYIKNTRYELDQLERYGIHELPEI